MTPHPQMGDSPVICFGQQPSGFLPKRFLVSKIWSAIQLQREVGGRIVFFYHDSDHDPRETLTVLVDPKTGDQQRLNFPFANKIQKKYTPAYAKRLEPDWQARVAPQLRKYLSAVDVEAFAAIRAETIADFCLEMLHALDLLRGIEVVRSSDVQFRRSACAVDDFFVDTTYDGELVRARWVRDCGLRLHKGGSEYIDLPEQLWSADQISPTRDTRLRWMQSVIQCTHYIAGAGEMKYLHTDDAPEIQFLPREPIPDPDLAYLP